MFDLFIVQIIIYSKINSAAFETESLSKVHY